MAEPLDRPASGTPPGDPGADELGTRLMAALERHGIFEAVVAAVEQSDELFAILVRELAHESRTQALRNAFGLMGMMARFPAEDLVRAVSEDPPPNLSLFALWRRLRSPAARRGMYRLSRMLEALGSEKAPGP
ncbi:MAG: DUF1641 domain-containing protein [Clostridia bacterium]